MKLVYSASAFLFASALAASAKAECSTTWKCQPIPDSKAPVLDGDLAEWADMTDVFSTSLTSALSGTTYMEGEAATYRCVYDTEKIYFGFEIPGEFRFNATDNEKCASIATMTKIGVDATFYNMGGCPDALAEGSCDNGVPDTCETYRVDIGAHWELSTTEQGVAYAVTGTSSMVSAQSEEETGDISDEFAVSPYCRLSDNGLGAANEWEGAWLHTNPVDGELGMYRFEVSRLLTTPSQRTDAQMTPGETYSFGVAFWDPYETEDGWTDPGHYVTGCAAKWIDLELVAAAGSQPTDGGTPSNNQAGGSSGALGIQTSTAVVVAIFGFIRFLL